MLFSEDCTKDLPLIQAYSDVIWLLHRQKRVDQATRTIDVLDDIELLKFLSVSVTFCLLHRVSSTGVGLRV